MNAETLLMGFPKASGLVSILLHNRCDSFIHTHIDWWIECINHDWWIGWIIRGWFYIIDSIYCGWISELYNACATSASTAMAMDKFSALDDTLIFSHIIFELFLKESTHCSLLSWIWRSLWIVISRIRLSNAYFEEVFDTILFFHSTEGMQLRFFLGKPKLCSRNLFIVLNSSTI